MKKVLVIVITGCVLFINHGIRAVAAEDDGLPLSALEGTYSFTAHGSQFLCVKDTPPFPFAKCGSPGTIGLPFTLVDVGTSTSSNGTSCSTFTETDSDLPVDISPPFVGVLDLLRI